MEGLYLNVTPEIEERLEKLRRQKKIVSLNEWKARRGQRKPAGAEKRRKAE